MGIFFALAHIIRRKSLFFSPRAEGMVRLAAPHFSCAAPAKKNVRVLVIDGHRKKKTPVNLGFWKPSRLVSISKQELAVFEVRRTV